MQTLRVLAPLCRFVRLERWSGPAVGFAHLSAQQLADQLCLFRWLVAPLVFILAAFHEWAGRSLALYLPLPWRAFTELAVFGLTGSIVAWLGLSWLAIAIGRYAAAETELRQAYTELEINHQQLLRLHDWGQRIAAAEDEEAVLELAAQAPLQLTEARATSIVTFDPEKNRLKLDMAWGLSERYLHRLRTQLEQGVDAERCRHCTALKTQVKADCPLFVGMGEIAQAEGIGSLACLPLIRDRERVGILSAYFPASEGPPPDQVRLLNILGGAIVAMLESVRLRTRQMRTLYALDRATTISHTLGSFTDQVLEILISGWEATAGGLFFYQPETQTWTCQAARGLGSDWNHPFYRLALDLVQQAQAQGTPVFMEDAAANSQGLLSAVAIPLLIESRVMGAIFLGAQRHHAFHERQLDLLRTVAHQTALAIHQARLYERLEQMGILEERYRLAREIHDGLAQTLSYLSLQTERLETLLAGGRLEAAQEELGELRRTVRAAYIDVREAIDGLRLTVEKTEAFAERLRNYVEEFGRQSGLAVSCTIEPPTMPALDAVTGLHLLRIVQEALTNVRKHAAATQVQVHLRCSEPECELSITDNGRGFPVPPVPSHRRSHGLAIMRERAQAIGGTMTVATGPGQGTRVIILIPRERKV